MDKKSTCHIFWLRVPGGLGDSAGGGQRGRPIADPKGVRRPDNVCKLFQNCSHS